jgi:hypothetical protein
MPGTSIPVPTTLTWSSAGTQVIVTPSIVTLRSLAVAVTVTVAGVKPSTKGAIVVNPVDRIEGRAPVSDPTGLIAQLTSAGPSKCREAPVPVRTLRASPTVATVSPTSPGISANRSRRKGNAA